MCNYVCTRNMKQPANETTSTQISSHEIVCSPDQVSWLSGFVSWPRALARFQPNLLVNCRNQQNTWRANVKLMSDPSRDATNLSLSVLPSAQSHFFWASLCITIPLNMSSRLLFCCAAPLVATDGEYRAWHHWPSRSAGPLGATRLRSLASNQISSLQMSFNKVLWFDHMILDLILWSNL